jgi:hypothetical protein
MFQHPDDRSPLTDHERDEFRRICDELTGGDPALARASAEPAEGTHAGSSAAVIVCTVLVFIGLAVNSVFLIVVATAGGIGAHLSRTHRSW